MKELLDKLSSYNIFNYLLPGILFVVISKYVSTYSIVQTDILLGVFLYYFLGLVISRIGSLLIEPSLKHMHFVSFSDYKDFVLASKADPKIDLFSEINNMYRTMCSLFLNLILLNLFERATGRLPWCAQWNTILFLIGFLLLFLFSYRKQTAYINKRIEALKQQKGE